jgi:hypothetical protein
MCKLLTVAAQRAKGSGSLKDDGEYCLWGKAAQLAGANTYWLEREGAFEDMDIEDLTEGKVKAKKKGTSWFSEVPEAESWDDAWRLDDVQERKESITKLIERLCKRFKNKTVGHFRAGLKNLGFMTPTSKRAQHS